MPSDHRTVDVEFLGNSRCWVPSCNRISFHDGSQLVLVDFQWPATMLFIFKALVSFAELLESALSCLLVSSSWASYIVDVASCLHSFITNFEPTAQYCGYYPEIKLMLPALEARSLNQRTTREVPLCVFAFFFFHVLTFFGLAFPCGWLHLIVSWSLFIIRHLLLSETVNMEDLTLYLIILLSEVCLWLSKAIDYFFSLSQ